MVVTEPETYGNSVTLPTESRQLTKPCTVLQGASKYNMEELEEFLQSVEACLPKSLQDFQLTGENEIEAILSVIAACPEIGPMDYFSPQVQKKMHLSFQSLVAGPACFTR